MVRNWTSAVLAGCVTALAADWGGGASAQESAAFREAYGLIRSHLVGVTPADLDRAAIDGLVGALSPKVALVKAGSPAPTNLAAVSQSSVFDGSVLYVRVAAVSPGLAPALRQACSQWGASNQIQGVVLDLRFAAGTDYSAAAAAARLFVKGDRPLINWGEGVVRSGNVTNAIGLPVAILVNRATSGASEALAAMVRDGGAGLLLGAPTAGQAFVFEEFPLSGGDRLRVATGSVKMGDGAALAGGVNPDILVEVPPAEERVHYADPYKATAVGTVVTGGGTGTNNARRVRFNEAELVRERREGASADDGAARGRKPEPEVLLVQDPVLVRALDLLKGLAVVRQGRSSSAPGSANP